VLKLKRLFDFSLVRLLTLALLLAVALPSKYVVAQEDMSGDDDCVIQVALLAMEVLHLL
jgi:hypothetical protein